jgi:Uma2 family endonuclease
MIAAMSAPAAPRHRYSYRDYRAVEEGNTVKHEFFDGEIYAMAGGTPEHAALCAEIIAAVRAALGDRPCRVFTSDLRVRVLETGLATYPDATVICGDIERDPEDALSAVNPVLLVEVLSSATEAYDRGEKLEHYRRIPSLEECVLVSQRERLIEVWRRGDGGSWRRDEARAGRTAELASVGASLDVDRLYDRAFGDPAALR